LRPFPAARLTNFLAGTHRFPSRCFPWYLFGVPTWGHFVSFDKLPSTPTALFPFVMKQLQNDAHSKRGYWQYRP
jgi:hypothetical protein